MDNTIKSYDPNKCDFEKCGDIKDGEEVWYITDFWLSPRKYLCMHKGKRHKSVYLIITEGSCSDIKYLGGVETNCSCVFSSRFNAIKFQQEVLQHRANYLKNKLDHWEENHY